MHLKKVVLKKHKATKRTDNKHKRVNNSKKHNNVKNTSNSIVNNNSKAKQTNNGSTNSTDNTNSNVPAYYSDYYYQDTASQSNNTNSTDKSSNTSDNGNQKANNKHTVTINYTYNGKNVGSAKLTTDSLKSDNNVYDYQSLNSLLFKDSWLDKNKPAGNYVLKDFRHFVNSDLEINSFADNSDNFNAFHNVKPNSSINIELNQYKTVNPVVENPNITSLRDTNLTAYQSSNALNSLNNFLKLNAGKNTQSVFDGICETGKINSNYDITMLKGNNDDKYLENSSTKTVYNSDDAAKAAYNIAVSGVKKTNFKGQTFEQKSVDVNGKTPLQQFAGLSGDGKDVPAFGIFSAEDTPIVSDDNNSNLSFNDNLNFTVTKPGLPESKTGQFTSANHQSGSIHYLYFLDKNRTDNEANNDSNHLNVYYYAVPVYNKDSSSSETK